MEPKKVFAIALMALLLSLVALDTASNITGFNISNFTGDNMTNIFTGNNVTNLFTTTTNNYTNNYTNTTVDNGSIQINESQVTNLTTDLNSKVNKSGDTMTGSLTINTSLNGFLFYKTINKLSGSSSVSGFSAVTDIGALTLTTRNSGYTDDVSLAGYGVVRTDSGLNGLKLIAGGTKPLIFETDDINRMTIDTNGAVVIYSLPDTKTTALCIDSNEKLFRSTNATSGYLTC